MKTCRIAIEGQKCDTIIASDLWKGISLSKVIAIKETDN